MAENPNKISQIQVGSVTYDIYDAATRILLPAHEKDDLSWVTVSLNSTDIEPYSNTTIPKICRWGSLVNFAGAVKLKADQTANFTVTIATLPSKYRPDLMEYFLQQGSSTSQWLLTVGSTTGDVTMSRLSQGGTYVAGTTTMWFPFNITYMVPK